MLVPEIYVKKKNPVAKENVEARTWMKYWQSKER
jgi:hypothetical protein